MSKGELSLDLIGRFGLVVAGTAVGIGIITFLLNSPSEKPEFDQEVSDYCLSFKNVSEIGRTDFFNLLKSYYSGCERHGEFEIEFTLLKEDLEKFTEDEGITSDGEPAIVYTDSLEGGIEYFKGIIIKRDEQRVLLREGENIEMYSRGDSVVVE